MPKISESIPPRIVVDEVQKTFRLRHTHSMKEAFIAALQRKPLTSYFHALDGTSFTIADGESVALLGFNGSGKSTTLKLMSGVLTPDSGTVLTRGRVAGLIEVGAGFHPDLSGRENVYLNAAILGMTRAETDARFDDIVAFSEIEEFIDTEVKHYSSGMFLRLAFSVAIHTELDVLLIDEILAVGDEPFQRKCLTRIRELHSQGKTLVVVSHDLGMVSRLCSRGIVLAKGKVVFDGPSIEAVQALRALSESPLVDIDRGHPFFEQIMASVESGALPAYRVDETRREFRPDEAVTLSDVALALHTTLAPDTGRGDNGDPVSWLAGHRGPNARDAIEPTRIITRRDFAVWLHAVVDEPHTVDAMPFSDVSAVDADAAAIRWLFFADVSRGWEDSLGLPSFRPSLPMTRESLAIMLSRLDGNERMSRS